MKFLSILTIILVFSECGSLKFEENPPFTITSATYTKWVGGQPGVSGTNINISYSSNSAIQFDSVYFHKRAVELEKKDSNVSKMIIGYYTNGRKDFLPNKNSTKELKKPIPEIKKIPFDLKEHEAVISYMIKGKIKYYKIKSVKKIKTVLYPSAPKQ